VYEWVEKKLGNEPVRFRLITGGAGVRPFYIMESKVWNELYRAGGSEPPPLSIGNGSRAPVVLVTAGEAAAFAKKLGGSLPSPQQWDHAAGLYAVKDRESVTLPTGKAHVGESQPRATVGPEAGNDLNEFHLRDMAGNGREWTGGVLPPEADGRVCGIVRGRSFTMKDALTFQHLRDQQKMPQTQFLDVGSPYTSFRVVLPGP
jgi:formylglycine-generating enzyme required for sulfatase activity